MKSEFLFDKQQVCNYLVAYQHLCDSTALHTPEDIAAYIRRVGCIQFDPLDVVGRNPDLVLQSRCTAYKKGDIERQLYVCRDLFDVWDKNMSVCAVSDWPCFSRFRKGYLKWCGEHREAVDQITGYLKEHESACSSDFDLEERVGWHYGPQRLAKAALECMCYAGLAVVHHKKGTRRYYCLAENAIPQEYYTLEDPNKTDDEYFQWFVLRRIKSIGLLWNRQSDAWLGLGDFKSDNRSRAFNALLKDGRIIEIAVSGIKHPLYVPAENIDLLRSVTVTEVESRAARILAPLDNLLWDRKLIGEIFGFEYKWEVYTPAAERKFGYYVLPVLCGSVFAGRIELDTDKKTRTLVVKRFWPEAGVDVSHCRDRIQLGLTAFARYNLCEQIKRNDCI